MLLARGRPEECLPWLLVRGAGAADLTVPVHGWTAPPGTAVYNEELSQIATLNKDSKGNFESKVRRRDLRGSWAAGQGRETWPLSREGPYSGGVLCARKDARYLVQALQAPLQQGLPHSQLSYRQAVFPGSPGSQAAFPTPRTCFTRTHPVRLLDETRSLFTCNSRSSLQEYQFKLQAPERGNPAKYVTLGKAALDMARYTSDGPLHPQALKIRMQMSGNRTAFLSVTVAAAAVKVRVWRSLQIHRQQRLQGPLLALYCSCDMGHFDGMGAKRSKKCKHGWTTGWTKLNPWRVGGRCGAGHGRR